MPTTCPHGTPPGIVDAILQARWRHPRWGAKKLLAILERGHPDWPWPARSTVSDILRRNGLVPKRRRRRALGHPGKPQSSMAAPNDTWTADLKGHFRTRDGRYCYPLTDVYFGPVKLGCLHERSLRIEDALGRQYRKKVSPMYPD